MPRKRSQFLHIDRKIKWRSTDWLCILSVQGEEKGEEEGAPAAGGAPGDKSKMNAQDGPGKYVPPSMRVGASKKGESMMSARGRGMTFSTWHFFPLNFYCRFIRLCLRRTPI